MTWKLVILPEAVEDLAEVRRWYEARSVGLGNRFLSQAEDCIRRIQAFPDLCEQVCKAYRRAIVRRFPFVVFYEPSTDGIIICAVFHTAQDPKKWRRRLR